MYRTSPTHQTARDGVIDSAQRERRSTVPGGGAMPSPGLPRHSGAAAGFVQNDFHGAVDWAKANGLLTFPVKVERRGSPRRPEIHVLKMPVHKRRSYFREWARKYRKTAAFNTEGNKLKRRLYHRVYMRRYRLTHPQRMPGPGVPTKNSR